MYTVFCMASYRSLKYFIESLPDLTDEIATETGQHSISLLKQLWSQYPQNLKKKINKIFAEYSSLYIWPIFVALANLHVSHGWLNPTSIPKFKHSIKLKEGV